MPGNEGGHVSRHAFQVAYDGGSASGHTMDVEALAPALLAFGKLIRESNAVLNQNRATVKVLVTSDFEHKCFNVNFEVVQTILQKMQSLLQEDNVKTAIDILQKIGIVASAGGSVVGTLIGFLKWKRGRKIEKVQEIRDTTSAGSILLQVQIEGDSNTIQIPSDVLRLAENKGVLDAVKNTLEPIEKGDADRIEFRREHQPTSVLDKEATKLIVRSCDSGPDQNLPEEIVPEPETITATLYVHGPVFDTKAPNWRFRYRKKKFMQTLPKRLLLPMRSSEAVLLWMIDIELECR
jgi:hypothetical protein